MHTARVSPRHIAPVATVLDPADRAEVDRVGAGLYRTVHRDTVEDVLHDLRVRRVSAVLLSATRCCATELPRAMRVVHEFPRIPAFVLLTRSGTPTADDLLALGNCGIQHLVDVRTPDGWNRLREALAADVAHERDAEVAAELALDLQETPVDFSRFVQALFTDNERPRTVRTLAAGLGVLPSTLMSRFFRAGLPAPKRYLAYAGLVRAARMLENPGLSIADVAYRLNHSSPQSFGRHIFTFMKLSAGEFRRTHDGVRMMQRFREELIAPYRERIAWVSPLIMRPRGMRPKLPAAHH
ncbi:hypothetical protein LBMAG44_10210 [Gemmatimonadota bacterium]|nr:hypothetical protein LBMAG44_10210 [Gemmatimonadota bacterium]